MPGSRRRGEKSGSVGFFSRSRASTEKPRESRVLELLMQYCMAQRAGLPWVDGIGYAGIMNPLKNVSYLLDLEHVEHELLFIQERVLGYKL